MIPDDYEWPIHNISDDQNCTNEVEDDLIDAFQESQCYSTELGTIDVKAHERNSAIKRLYSAERLLSRLSSNESIHYSVHNAEGVYRIKAKGADAKRFIEALQFGAYNYESLFPYHEMNPYLKVLFAAMEIVKGIAAIDDVFKEKAIPQLIVDGLNEAAQYVRETIRSSAFIEQQRSFQVSANKNAKSLRAYIDGLFDKYARLVVIRIDLGYRNCNIDATSVVPRRSYQDAIADRDRLLNNRRNNYLFDEMVGYVWKLEYSVGVGFHYHFIFFYNGQNVRCDGAKAGYIGRYWIKLTDEKGTYYNCNANKFRYKRLGIGTVNHFDTIKRDNLYLAASYLTKIDYFIKLKSNSIGRSFGKGELPASPSVIRMGRPRNSFNDPTKNVRH